MQTTIETNKKTGGKELVIRYPLNGATPSASGKTMVIASTRGNKEVDAEYEGKKITIGLNAYVRK